MVKKEGGAVDQGPGEILDGREPPLGDLVRAGGDVGPQPQDGRTIDDRLLGFGQVASQGHEPRIGRNGPRCGGKLRSQFLPQGIAGGVNNFVTFERVEAARLAAKRFLGQPGEVPFPARTQVLEERPPVTVDSVRKMLMQLQLADGDADLVRIHRMRLDQIAEQMQRAVDNDTRTRLQRALEALEVEVRGSF